MRRPALALVVGLAFLAPEGVSPIPPAQAAQGEQASPIEEARAHFHKGVQLFNESSFEAALAEFRKAYLTSANFRVLYNIAQTYFELHDYVNAYKILKQYVQDGNREITAARRIEVDELNKKLEERIAYLNVVVNRDGADIRIDDISVGTSPLAGPVLVNAGPRKVAAVKPGYDTAVRLVTVTGAEKVQVILEIPNPVVARTIAPQAVTTPAVETAAPVEVVPEPAPASKPSRVGLYTSLGVAGGCAVATVVFGLLSLQAKRDFNKELDKIPNTQANIDDARSKTKTYVYITDGFGAATLLSAGVALYFFLSSDDESDSNQQDAKKISAALTPTLGGFVFHGRW